MFAARSVLFGLIHIPQWAYDWGYSKAYIELMCLDTTIIHYTNEDDKKRKKEEDIKEATMLYYKKMAQKGKGGDNKETTIKLK